MSLPKAYEPKKYEEKIYEKWEKSGFFNPDNLPENLTKENGESFSVMMPPPNVTGVLHLGHALENTIMDIEVRYQRMQGKKAIIVPGTDHAAVATQAKVEKLLIEEGMKNPREELGRERLLEKIREYAENSKSTIIGQIKRVGTSCDWSRLAYTFDKERNKAVNEVFKKMYDDGLIYRGYRVVNWSVKGQSTCSDDELIYIDQQTKLYTFKYSKDFPIAISTTRPETKLGDTAVAVNPDDERYKEYIGKIFTVDVEAEKPLEIKIIADEEVDPDFGTGALGVTPAHSLIDFEMYEKHDLKLIPVIGEDGKMTKNAGRNYQGLTVNEAREKFVKWLNDNELMKDEKEITHNVGTSDRFGDVIESIPMTQWFVDVNKKITGRNKSLKELVKEAVEIGHNGDKKQKINLIPESQLKRHKQRIENLYDWCISRQIWWGHRIPIWYKDDEVKFSIDSPGKNWQQDPDTLDTWFSSGMWTFSTLGWPEKTEDLKKYHPTAWMQMGHEILFLWFQRMIMFSTYALDEIPFRDVYIHGMLRDKDGRKFSKSLGNGIDPIEVINQYGADALRLSLSLGITPGNDSRFFEEKIEGGRNFVNKLWNISRFVLEKVGEKEIGFPGKSNFKDTALTPADVWILNKLNSLTKDVTTDLESYQFSQAGEKLREFTWNDFADWYLEIAKVEDNAEKDEILIHVLQTLLKLWHPFIPFVTEQIWSEMKTDNMLIAEKWAETASEEISDTKEKEANFNLIQKIVSAIRTARAENKIAPEKKVEAKIFAGEKLELVESQKELIKNLRTGIEKLEITKTGEKIEGEIYTTVGDIEIYLIGAIDKEKEKFRLEKEIVNLKKITSNLDKKLSNKEFVKKAPKKIVTQEKEKLKIWTKELEKLETQLKNLK